MKIDFSKCERFVGLDESPDLDIINHLNYLAESAKNYSMQDYDGYCIDEEYNHYINILMDRGFSLKKILMTMELVK